VGKFLGWVLVGAAAASLLGGCASGVDRGFAAGDDRNRTPDGAVSPEDAAVNTPDDSAVVPDVDGHPEPDAAADLDAAVEPDAPSEPDAAVDPEPMERWSIPCPACPWRRPRATNILISEVMIASITGSGDKGEWFEIHNVGNCIVDLAGLQIVSPTGSGAEKVHAIVAGTIDPDGYFVLALSGNASDNHGLKYDYVYENSALDDVVLNNSADWIELRAGGLAIDRVSWPSSGFAYGATKYFPSNLDPGLNDDWSKWLVSTSSYSSMGGTFLGTPGAP
jgi:hypothetical protein